MDALYRGLFVLPLRRVERTAIDGPSVLTLLLGFPPLLLLVSRRFSEGALRRHDVALILGLESVAVVLSGFSVAVAATLWTAVRMSAPLIVIASAILLDRAHSEMPAIHRNRLYLLASVAAWCGLIQFPTDSYQYFLYVLPLFVFAAVALATFRGTVAPSVATATLLAFMTLGLLIRPVFIHGGGSHVVLTGEPTGLLELPRGGLTVRRAERDEYVQLVRLIQRHSHSRYIFATPDAPEVYFLAGRENPTRVFFDYSDDPRDRTARVLRAIRDHDADVVVLNKAPRFSDQVPADLRDSLRARFGSAADVGLFQVRW
jgi:hypothetical protein